MNPNILNPIEKENLNILLGFILRKQEDEEKKSKDDQNLYKLRSFNNFDLVYVPQKTQNSQKENEDLKHLLSSYDYFPLLNKSI